MFLRDIPPVLQDPVDRREGRRGDVPLPLPIRLCQGGIHSAVMPSARTSSPRA